MIKLGKNEYKISNNGALWTVLFGLGNDQFTSKWAKTEVGAQRVVNRLLSGESPTSVPSGLA